MKSFTIIYDIVGRRYETTQEAWTRDQAIDLFRERNPGCELVECYES